MGTGRRPSELDDPRTREQDKPPWTPHHMVDWRKLGPDGWWSRKAGRPPADPPAPSIETETETE